MSAGDEVRNEPDAVHPRAAEMADYLDTRLRMAGSDELAIGRALLLVSELHGMSRVGDACGLNTGTMRRQLNGTRPLYVETLLAVTRALGIRLRAEAG